MQMAGVHGIEVCTSRVNRLLRTFATLCERWQRLLWRGPTIRQRRRSWLPNLTTHFRRTRWSRSIGCPRSRQPSQLERKDPERAVELSKVASTIELGQPSAVTVILCPVYLRGEAYLMLHDGNAAATEFRKFVEREAPIQ